MIRNAVLNAQAAEPAVCQVDLDLAAQHPLRADRKYVADDKHPDHELRIDRGPAHLGIIGRELPMHPRQIKDRSNLANEVIVRNNLIKMELIKQLSLIVVQPPHHRPPPQQNGLRATESLFAAILNGLLQQNRYPADSR